MIQRIAIPLLIAIVLSDLYIDILYFRRHYRISGWMRALWWLPCLIMVVYTCALASIKSFAPSDLTWLNLYLLLIGLFVGPKAIFAICSSIGWVVRKTIIRTHRNYGHFIGLGAGFIAVVAYIYGLTVGIGQIRVRHIDLYFKDLPVTFEGYKIAHVSDLHIGTFDGWRKRILRNEMDSLRKQHADLICFTGDLQNMRPQEVKRMLPILKTGMNGDSTWVISVLGNHDYAEYVKHTPHIEQDIMRQLLSLEQDSLHWTVLNNDHRAIVHFEGRPDWESDVIGASQKICFVGTENDGRPPFPQRADWKKAFEEIHKNDFVIVLQHDPSAWERTVLPKTNAQLTLSGHTHGGQMQIFGWRPTMLSQHEDYGLYERNGRYLYVTSGLGGLVPFRLNMPNEIVVITLHRAQQAGRHRQNNPNGNKFTTLLVWY